MKNGKNYIIKEEENKKEVSEMSKNIYTTLMMNQEETLRTYDEDLDHYEASPEIGLSDLDEIEDTKKVHVTNGYDEFLSLAREENRYISGNAVSIKHIKSSNLYEVSVKKLDLKFKISAIDLDSYSSIIALINDLLREKDNKESLIKYWSLDSNEFIKETILTKADSVSALIFEYKIFKKLNDGTERFIRTANITIMLHPYISYGTQTERFGFKMTVNELMKKHNKYLGKVSLSNVNKLAGALAILFELIETKRTDGELSYNQIVIPKSYKSNTSSDLSSLNMLLRYSSQYNVDFRNGINVNFLDFSNRSREVFNSEKKKPDTKGRNKLSTKTPTGFDSVYGLQTVKDQLTLIAEGMKYNYKNLDNPIDIPKGVLLIGYPGTGKTLITKSFVKEFGFNLIEMSQHSSEDGINTNSINNAFRLANRSAEFAPTVLFIDELDKVFTKYNQQNVTVLLEKLSSSSNVLVIAAANQENFHEALTRPGRFDKKIYFGDISFDSKVEIFKHILDDKEVSYKDINITSVIDYLPKDATVAHLDALAKQIKLKEVIKEKNISTSEAIQLSEELVDGLSEVVKFDESSRNIIAFHEAGHAAMALLLNKEITVATIKNGFHYGGYVRLRYKEDVWETYDDYRDSILISLGGWVAEKLMFDQFSVGAGSDFRSVQSLINYFITGTGDSGTDVLSVNPFLEINQSQEQSSAIFKAKRKKTKKFVKEAIKLLKKNKQLLIDIRDSLMMNEKVSGEELLSIYEDYKVAKGIR